MMVTEEGNSQFGILELPPEVLLNIFRFIDVRNLYGVVIMTCKHFYGILTSEGIWKALFGLKWEEHSVTNDLSFINSWSNVYITYEDIECYWKKSQEQFCKDFVSKKLVGHYGIVDAVYIMPSREIMVSGSRDRNAFVWPISTFVDSNFETVTPSPEVLNGHTGWIWAITSDKSRPNEVVTVSWDKTVRVWDLQTNGTCANTFNYHPAAVLTICCENSIHTTGCYDKKIRRFDTRSGKVVMESLYHKKPVLSLLKTDNYIFSGSDDRTVGIFDIRADKLLTRLRVDTSVYCMNLAKEQGLDYLRVGGKSGSLYLFDISSEGRFHLLNSLELWNDKHKVAKLCNYRGCLIACSEGGAIRAYTPDRQCTFIRKLYDAHIGGVTSCHANRNLLVTGGSDSSVVTWKFKTPNS